MVRDGSSDLIPFFEFLATSLEPPAIEANTWLWIIRSEDDFHTATNFVASNMLEFDYV